jgi:hypothetical protein
MSQHTTNHHSNSHSKVTHHSQRDYTPTIKSYRVSICITNLISTFKHKLVFKVYAGVKAHDTMEAFRVAKLRCKELNPTHKLENMQLSSVWEELPVARKLGVSK